MLRNVRIKHLILMSVGVLLAILLLMGTLSILAADSIAGKTQILYNQPHTNLVDMWRMKTKVLQVGAAIKDGIVSQSAVQQEALQGVSDVAGIIQALENNKVDKSSGPSEGMKKIMAANDLWSVTAQQLASAINASPSTYPKDLFLTYVEQENALVEAVDTIIVTATTNAKNFKDNAMREASGTQTLLILLLAAAVALSLAILAIILRSISKPVAMLTRAADEIANGNLSEEIRYISNNEFGEIARNFRKMQNNLSTIIQDIARMLYEMGQGNFNIDAQAEYIGDFQPIRQSMNRIVDNLSKAFLRINSSSGEVSQNADNLSSGSQALSQGASEQASSVEELSATIGQIADQTRTNAEHASSASRMVEDTRLQVVESNQRMEKMTTAISQINDKADQIEKIIKTIEDIAFQTNILALNAAVEAARAGQAGKGFAVVADEVRNLAGKSAEAAQNTTQLISSTVEAVNTGTGIAQEAAEAMRGVVDSIEKVAGIVKQISDASGIQATATAQAVQGIDQIAIVVQTNSATAEKTATASEELSDEARSLKDLVDKFRVKGQAAPRPLPLEVGRAAETSAFDGDFGKY